MVKSVNVFMEEQRLSISSFKANRQNLNIKTASSRIKSTALKSYSVKNNAIFSEIVTLTHRRWPKHDFLFILRISRKIH
jgi:hypothetical protein